MGTLTRWDVKRARQRGRPSSQLTRILTGEGSVVGLSSPMQLGHKQALKTYRNHNLINRQMLQINY